MQDEHNHDHNHDHEEGNSKDDNKEAETVSAPKGSASHGWLWVVGIIIVVAVALFFLQRSVPEGADDAALIDGDEVTVETREAGIYSVDTVDSVPAGGIFPVDWEVSVPEASTIGHTAVHWDTVSHSGNLANYPNATQEYYEGEFAVPGTFETNIQAPDEAEAIYFVAHANIDGQDYIAAEMMVEVEAEETEEETEDEE